MVDAKTYRRIDETFLKRGFDGWSAEERAIVEAERRSFSSGTNNTGGYTVSAEFSGVIDVALKQSSSVWESAKILDTETGAPLKYPTVNFTTVAGSIVAENSASTLDSSSPFGVVNYGAYTYRSTMLPVSREYLEDSAFDPAALAAMLVDSVARASNAHFTTGTGTGQPTGLVTAATVGKVGLTGQTLTVIYDDLVDLIASVDPAYSKQSPKVRVGFMMSQSTLAIVRKIKDSAGAPLIVGTVVDQDGITRPQILGYPCFVNADMPAAAANAKSIAFGMLSKVCIRRGPTHILRLEERYADNLQIGFQAIFRVDGNLLDAGTRPLKLYQHSAT